MNWIDKVSFTSDGLVPAIAQDHQTGRVLMMAWMNTESLKLTVTTKTAVYFSRSRQKLWHKGETSGHVQHVHSIRLDCDADVIVLSVTQIGNIACHTGRESCFYQELDLSKDEPVWNSVDPIIKDPNDIYGQMKTSNSSLVENALKKNEAVDVVDEVQLHSKEILKHLDTVLMERKQVDPSTSYVSSLYSKGLNKILEKVGEESVESIIAAKDYQFALDTKPVADITSETKPLKDDLIYEIADVWFHTIVVLAWFDIDSSTILDELSRRFGLSGIAEKASR